MNEARVEAAHKAWREQAKQPGTIFEYNLRAALEAADADTVVFSDAAVERAARTIYGFSEYKPWDKRGDDLHRIYREQARAVIAALKGDEG
jgi:hypothetical protein